MSYYYEKQNPTGNGKIKHNTICEPISTALSYALGNVPNPIKKPPMPEVVPPKVNDINTVIDNVNHPSHYNDGKIEVIDYIEDKQLGFCLGNAVKYISRAGKKKSGNLTDKEKEIEDLKKAVFYINYRIKELEEQNE